MGYLVMITSDDNDDDDHDGGDNGTPRSNLPLLSSHLFKAPVNN